MTGMLLLPVHERLHLRLTAALSFAAVSLLVWAALGPKDFFVTEAQLPSGDQKKKKQRHKAVQQTASGPPGVTRAAAVAAPAAPADGSSWQPVAPGASKDSNSGLMPSPAVGNASSPGPKAMTAADKHGGVGKSQGYAGPSNTLPEFAESKVNVQSGEAKDILVAQGGNLEKSLVVHVHFHASSGKRMCLWAQQAHKDGQRSGIKMDHMQLQSSACNQIDPDPPDTWLAQNLQTCDDLRGFCRRHQGSTWQFIETALDVRPPCPGVAFITIMRQPWIRLESTQGKLGWLFPNSSAVLRNAKVGDDPLDPASRWNFCPVPHAPVCNGIFKAGYFDNFHIRFLLGSGEGARIPWGGINEEHLRRAKQILEAFDLVIPIDNVADALPALQCAVGPKYDIGIDGTPGGRYNWPTERRPTDWARATCKFRPPASRHDRERLELCTLFNAQNRWDNELYEWVFMRWRNWQAGRCRSFAAGKLPEQR